MTPYKRYQLAKLCSEVTQLAGMLACCNPDEPVAAKLRAEIDAAAEKLHALTAPGAP